MLNRHLEQTQRIDLLFALRERSGRSFKQFSLVVTKCCHCHQSLLRIFPVVNFNGKTEAPKYGDPGTQCTPTKSIKKFYFGPFLLSPKE